MRFSNVVTYKGDRVHPAGEYYVVKTGLVRIRLLKPGDRYEKSFKVFLKAVSNRRPADVAEPDEDDETTLEGLSELTDLAELTDPNEDPGQAENEEQDVPEDEFQPQ